VGAAAKAGRYARRGAQDLFTPEWSIKIRAGSVDLSRPQETWAVSLRPGFKAFSPARRQALGSNRLRFTFGVHWAFTKLGFNVLICLESRMMDILAGIVFGIVLLANIASVLDGLQKRSLP